MSTAAMMTPYYPAQPYYAQHPMPQQPIPATQPCTCADCQRIHNNAGRLTPPQQRVYTHRPYNPQNSVAAQYAAPLPIATRQESFSDTASIESHAVTYPSEDHSSEDEAGESALMQSVSVYSIQQCTGRVATMAMSAHGSSFIQYALRKYPTEAFEVFSKEIFTTSARLLADKNACYVVKALCEMMAKPDALRVLLPVLQDSEYMIHLCTKDLHSRRMVQFLLESSGPAQRRAVFDLLMAQPMRIVRTQQGCITAQRILDHVTKLEKETYFHAVRSNFLAYALDPFGHYLVEYMLTEGDQVQNSMTLEHFWAGQFAAAATHKYASTIVEKAFGQVTPELQRRIILELFNGPTNTVQQLLNTPSASYVLQAAIRCASHHDVMVIQQSIGHLLQFSAAGKKLHQRLQRRLAQC